jgi:hypothetical protein
MKKQIEIAVLGGILINAPTLAAMSLPMSALIAMTVCLTPLGVALGALIGGGIDFGPAETRRQVAAEPASRIATATA